LLKTIELWMEKALWNSRFLVVPAVWASKISAVCVFVAVPMDVLNIVRLMIAYVNPELHGAERHEARIQLVSHTIEVVDGYLLATALLIFALGLYELFVSDLEVARGGKENKILMIRSLDDLKNRLAKVILMILIVALFDEAIKLEIHNPTDLLLMGGSIASIGLALYLSHAAEGSHYDDSEDHGAKKPAAGDGH
jgi:uncharacterized membrane protein YqhA